MPRECGSRSRAALLAIVVSGAWAATATAPAEADDGVSPPLVATPDIGSLPALDTAIDRTLADAISAATGGNAPGVTPDGVDLPREEVGKLDTASDDATPAAAPADATQPSATDATRAESAPTGASPPDTTPDSADTTGDSATSAPTRSGADPVADAPAAEAPTSQPQASHAGQLNMNLNVRVSSPGSNGAVTQSMPLRRRHQSKPLPIPPDASRPRRRSQRGLPPLHLQSGRIRCGTGNGTAYPMKVSGRYRHRFLRMDPYRLRGHGYGTVAAIQSSINLRHRGSISRSTRTSRFGSTVPATTAR